MKRRVERPDRRAFAARVVKGVLLLGAAAVAAVSVLFVYPRRAREKRLLFVPACGEEDLPVRGVREYLITYARGEREVTRKVFLVRRGEDLYCLSSVCTHLGCLVSWHWRKKRFLCPCHGGQYDMAGRVLEGPPPAPLARLAVKVEGEQVYVGVKVSG